MTTMVVGGFRSKLRIIVPLLLWCTSILLTCAPAAVIGANVTLESIQIFQNHEEFESSEPSVYFECEFDQESKTDLTEVKKINFTYSIMRPVVQLSYGSECKSCGVYEKDIANPDDVFGVWKICASSFSAGNFSYTNETELIATFSCPDCNTLPQSEDSSNSPSATPSTNSTELRVCSGGVCRGDWGSGCRSDEDDRCRGNGLMAIVFRK
ncbi:unnamed protein product [Cuscuta epithymum]|uniref:DUF7953 domain-containing protein n=1 Tax=Cuscuta epithymum TaxID=186058 RepID=A0AAV0CKY7_9ASTE|nr:unnamed protein product [Cuscuta epithymum]